MRAKKNGWAGVALVLVVFFMIWGGRHKSDAPSSASSLGPLTESAAALSPWPASPPFTQSSFIGADRLNVRSAPKGTVVSTLDRGAAVEVYENRDGWSRISKPNEVGRWVSSGSLCAIADCWVRQPSTTKAQAPIELHTRPAQRTAPASYSSSCPCSSGNVCIGPRGGRYCITSGGNKRYGV